MKEKLLEVYSKAKQENDLGIMLSALNLAFAYEIDLTETKETK